MLFRSDEKIYENQPRNSMEHAGRLLGFISKLKQGEVYPEVIECMEGYQVVRLIKKEKEDAVIESVSVPKRNYDEWFWEKASKIPVKIYDKTLKDDLLNKVSWANKINLSEQ